jgi:hypothetical protein
MSRTVNTILVVVAVLVLLAGSFYGGMLYGKQQAQASFPQALGERFAQFGQGGEELGDPQQMQFMQGGAGQLGMQGGGLFGQIEEIDGDTLVVASFDGQQTRVQVTETTLVEKYASVTVENLEPGEQVVVSGSENEDGSITARSIQVAPTGRFAPGRGGGTRGGQ